MPFVVVAVAVDEEVGCPKCGNRLPAGLNAFCDMCGYPVFMEVKHASVGGPCRGHRRGEVLYGVRDGRRIYSIGRKPWKPWR